MAMMKRKAITFTLKCFTSAYMENNKDLERSDKIILPEICLRKLTPNPSDRIPEPVIFAIESKAEYKQAQLHCGVLEFTGEDDKAFLPNWIFDQLRLRGDTKLEIGGEMRFRLRTLDKVSKAVFRPVTKGFSNIPTPKQTLQYSLSRCTTLSSGQLIPIYSGSEQFLLYVVSMSTQAGNENAGCLHDSVVQADFEAGENEVEEEDVQLFFKNSLNAIIEENDYFYCRLKIPEVLHNCCFTLTSHEGHADIYIHQDMNRPTRQQHTWHCNNVDNEFEYTIPGEELRGIRWLYIGVHAYGAKTRFTLKPSDKIIKKEKKSGQKLYAAGDDDAKKDDPNFELCGTCGRYIPKMSMMMHSLNCARRNWLCPVCKVVLQRKEQKTHIHCDDCSLVFTSVENLEKHRELKHTVQPCPVCKEPVPAENLRMHMEEECNLRLVDCRWCGMKLQFIECVEHEMYCASQSIHCHLCQEPVARNKFDIHLSLKHNVNPSLMEGQRLIETQRIMDQLPIDADASDLQEAFKNASACQDEKIDKITEEMQNLLTQRQANSIGEEDLGNDISGIILSGGAEEVHDFPCPYCDQLIPVTIDFGDHLIICEEEN